MNTYKADADGGCAVSGPYYVHEDFVLGRMFQLVEFVHLDGINIFLSFARL